MLKRKILGMVLIMGMLFGQPVPHAQAAICNQVQFVADLTAPDGTTFAPGAVFTKTWRLKNIGTCTWTTAYTLVWVGGDAIGAPGPVKLPVNVAPNQTLDISAKLTAPTANGSYKGLWKLSDASGAQFGIGASGTDPFWVSINVYQTNAVIYDFVANAPYAQWKSGAGALPFPVTGGDDRGYAFQVDNPHLEDDSIDAAPGLMTVPQNKTDGYIQATYPEFQVQSGDQIQTLVNCEFAATSCYVTFRIDYRLANGTQRTLWSWKEAYDKKFYRASINLSSLAGQKVQFILMVLATGSASGDRALWGSPRIIRAGTTQPPAFPPTLTPLPQPAPTLTPFASPPPTIAPVGCDKATFITDVTVPDGTLFSPSTVFVKTWRLKNSGTCTWTTAYKLVFYSGEQMSAPTAINIPRNIAPGVTVDLTVNMTAPASAGTYRGYWILSNTTNKLFGIGVDASKPIWVEVNVSGGSPAVPGYDFVANACSAQWKSGAGILPCPGTEGDIKGYAIPKNSTQLEDGNIGPAPSLLMAPDSKYNGYIQGTYPLFTVLAGDHFRGNTGCAFGSSCYVTFRLDYMTSTGTVKTFWSWRESSDSKNNSFDLNLAPLAGQNVRFILTILATGSATNDKATWTAPYIVRLDTTGQVPPTVTPTNTPITMPGTIVPSPVINGLNMSDAFNGWAIGAGYLLRTNDGGVTWYNVTMPGVTGIGGSFFQNSMRAWVFGTLVEGNTSVLFHTIDGGRTWTMYNNLPFNGGFIQFLNDANGFVLSGLPSGMFKHAVDLYQTTDGGTTWVRKYTNNPLDPSAGTSLPFSGDKNGMTFRDTLRGWVSGESPLGGSVYLYKTNDSGTTWAQQSLPLPSGYANAPMSTYAPTFFNANDGVLPVWMSLDVGKRDLYIYVTHDGGTTWTRSTSFARQGWNASFASVNDGFTWNINGYLQVTHNAGASWTQVPSNINFGDDIPMMDFISTTTGWAVQNQVNGSSPLYRTTDGGKTWTLLSGSPNIPPTNTPAAPTPTSIPVVASLNASVTADLLSCRYGPGAEYLYLYALNKTANIKLIGRTDANNWVWVDGTNKCWVNTSYLQITGDPKSLPIVYPTGTAKLPVSPYYPAPAWASATRNGNSVGVEWAPVPVGAGDYEDASMHQYILEVWRCQAGQIIFETLGSSVPSIVVANDEAGCSVPSHGRVYVQEKHGFAGPVEVPWPAASPSTQASVSTPVPDSASTSTTVPQDLPSFEQTLVSTLNAHNFDLAKSMMNGSFGIAFWQSQGTSYTPDLAIEQLKNYIGATLLTADPGKNLNTLLGGSNPYSIMGLDPNNSQALFVSGWGLDGKGEAILFATRLADGTPYWHSVLVALTGFVVNTDPTTHDAFCADTRIAPLIEQLKGSLNQSNGDMFSALVSPTHGVDVRLWAYSAPVNFNTTSAKNIFADTTSYTWGGGPSGIPDIGAFKDTIQPKLLDVLNAPNIETYCDNLTKVYPLATPWPYPNVRYYNFYKPATSNGFDFRTWLVGIEYVNGQPYVSALVTIVWEP